MTCTTHHHACDCREAAHTAEVAALKTTLESHIRLNHEHVLGLQAEIRHLQSENQQARYKGSIAMRRYILSLLPPEHPVVASIKTAVLPEDF